MRYLSFYTPAPETMGKTTDPAHMEAMGQLVDDSMKAGTLVLTGGLMPIAKGGVRVRSDNGTSSVVDGPYTEAKELVGGFGDGQCDIYRIMGPDDMPHCE